MHSSGVNVINDDQDIDITLGLLPQLENLLLHTVCMVQTQRHAYHPHSVMSEAVSETASVRCAWRGNGPSQRARGRAGKVHSALICASLSSLCITLSRYAMATGAPGRAPDGFGLRDRAVSWLEENRGLVVLLFCLPASFVFSLLLAARAWLRQLLASPQHHDSR